MSYLFIKKEMSYFIVICDTIWLREQNIVKSSCGIQAVYISFNMFNGTGISCGERDSHPEGDQHNFIIIT